MPIESVMPSSHLILCRPLLLLPPIPPGIRVFSSESALRMRWPQYWCQALLGHFATRPAPGFILLSTIPAAALVYWPESHTLAVWSVWISYQAPYPSTLTWAAFRENQPGQYAKISLSTMFLNFTHTHTHTTPWLQSFTFPCCIRN